MENQDQSLKPRLLLPYSHDGSVKITGRGWLSPGYCSVYSPCSLASAFCLLSPSHFISHLSLCPPFHRIPQRISPNSKAADVGNQWALLSDVGLIHKGAGITLVGHPTFPFPLAAVFSPIRSPPGVISNLRLPWTALENFCILVNPQAWVNSQGTWSPYAIWPYQHFL